MMTVMATVRTVISSGCHIFMSIAKVASETMVFEKKLGGW